MGIVAILSFHVHMAASRYAFCHTGLLFSDIQCGVVAPVDGVGDGGDPCGVADDPDEGRGVAEFVYDPASGPLAQGANESCYKAADEAMAGVNPVGDCLFFRTVIPEISGKIIGNHVFYNP